MFEYFFHDGFYLREIRVFSFSKYLVDDFDEPKAMHICVYICKDVNFVINFQQVHLDDFFGILLFFFD